MIGFFVAIISGALMSIQGVFNTQVTKSSGVWAAASFVQFSALLVCLGAWLIFEKVPLVKVFSVEPKYMLLGGAIGAFITFTVVQSMSNLGPAKAALFIVVSQVVVAYGIELRGLFGVEKADFSVKKLIGMLIAIAGIILFKWE